MVLAKSTIADFDQFWSVFTTRGAEKRKKHGSKGARVFRNQENPNEIWILFDWNQQEFQEFLSDPEVPEIMKSASVQSPPEPVFIEPAGETDS